MRILIKIRLLSVTSAIMSVSLDAGIICLINKASLKLVTSNFSCLSHPTDLTLKTLLYSCDWTHLIVCSDRVMFDHSFSCFRRGLHLALIVSCQCKIDSYSAMAFRTKCSKIIVRQQSFLHKWQIVRRVSWIGFTTFCGLVKMLNKLHNWLDVITF